MRDNETVEALLQAWEWETLECKRANIDPSKLLNTVVAFANTSGGHIVIGLEDPKKGIGSQRLYGISENQENVSEFLKLIEKEISPSLSHLWTSFELEIMNRENAPDILFVVRVSKSSDVHSLKKGDTYIRRGHQNVKIGAEEIIRLKYEKGSLKFESEPTTIAHFDDIDQQMFDQFKKDLESQSKDQWQFLKDNGLAAKRTDQFVFTTAGILLFHKNPSIALSSKCGIKISHYYGTKPSYSGEPNFVRRPFTIEGPLLHQIEQTIQYFRQTVAASPPKLQGAKFHSSLLIPEWAFQEAITNAVIHRNYFLQDDIQVRFFDDRVEIESPGTYPGHINIQNIRTERFARNPIIVRALNRFQAAPNLDIGEGVDRMFTVMREHNLYDPLYISSTVRPNSVLVILLNSQKVEYWDTVSKYIEQHQSITNEEARRITGVADTLKMSRLLGSWVSKGLLERHGQKKKARYFAKSGPTIANTLFS